MRLVSRLRRTAPPPAARVAFNMEPLTEPWGGGNWWLTQIVRHLRDTGYSVSFDLDGRVDAIVLVDPRVGGSVRFGVDEIAAHKARHPEVRCLHRVNECDARKETASVDDLLAGANEVADHTVFISRWLRDYHAERWFDPSRPHSVVVNGADPAIFHPLGGEELTPGVRMRIVTHHWSDNPLKGFDVYQEVDSLISTGGIDDVELWVIGRWPESCEWRAARTFAPVAGPELGDLLRRGHVYLTASRWEPGGMHHVEGAQCGLPVLYHEDGGGIVELASRYGIGYGDDVAGAIAEMRAGYGGLRSRVLELAPAGDVMCADYRRVIERLLVS